MKRFAAPRAAYDPADERRFREAVEAECNRRYASGENIEMWPDTTIILRTSTGGRKRLIVHDDNTVTCEDA